MSKNDPTEAWKALFDQFRVEVDPSDIENSMRVLQEKIRQVANEGRYTKVRISYKGTPLCPDIPIGVIVAAEMAGLVFLGPLRAIMLTLNANAFGHPIDSRIFELVRKVKNTMATVIKVS